MTRLPPLLPRPAAEAVRLVALSYLEQARHARARLENPADGEALHDFRVALRRLRSWLRAFRPEFKGGVRRRSRRRLRALAASTGESRDLEVHLAWVREQIGDLNPAERVGAVWLLERMALRKRRADARLRRRLDREFPSLCARLARQLGNYQVEVSLGHETTLAHTRDVLGLKLAAPLAALRSELGQVHTIADERDAHEARIAAKRLRYLLEPFEPELAGAPEVVAGLKSLQDVLGDLHDAQVFSTELLDAMEAAGAQLIRQQGQRLLRWDGDPAPEHDRPELDPRPGVLALGSRLRARGEAAFGRFAAEWLEGRAQGFYDQVDRIVASLIPEHPEDVEIERKYLLRGLPLAVREGPAAEIEQGWLPGSRIVERVRRSRRNGSVHLTRTIKAGSGILRFEAEEEIQADLFDYLWPLTEGRRVRKRRYRVVTGGLQWEIDEFLDRELVLAEVELPTEGTAVELPDWLAPWVVREVTGEAEYVNRNLAQ